MGDHHAAILVRRGSIEGHERPTGGAFAASSWGPRWSGRIARRYLGIHCVDTADPVLALTYDDGPHPDHTPAILDALAAAGARATFFVMTPAARRHPEIVERIVAEGHALGLHGADHRSLRGRPAGTALAEILRARDDLAALAGTAVTLYRPPYGHHTLRQAALLRRHGLELIIWSGDGLDWIDLPPEEVLERLTAGAFPGAIPLLHDDRADPETLRAGEALPTFDKGLLTAALLDRLAGRGLRSIRIDELLAGRAPVFSASRDRVGVR